MEYKIENPKKAKPDYRNMPPKQMAERLEKQDAEIAELKQELSNVLAMIRLNNSNKYAGGSDSVPYPEGYEQLDFFNEAEKHGRTEEPEPSFESATRKVKKPKEKGKRERDLSGLSVTVIEHELPEEERTCPECGGTMHDMKTEVTRTLVLVPAHFEVEEHRRHVYTCRECEKNQDQGIKIPFVRAGMPELPMPGSFASPELLAGILNSKYVNHMPLARIEREFFRMDSVEISRQTMSNWVLKTAEWYFMPLAGKIREFLLSREILHADETYCTVAYEDGRESKKKCYMWVYCTGIHDTPAVYFEFHTTRAAEAAEHFLEGCSGIFLHTDGYAVYHGLKPDITVIGCLSHIKRKFAEGIKSLDKEAQKETLSYRGQEYCDAIFHMEKRLKDLSPEERYEKRLTWVKPIMDAFFAWLNEIFPETVPDTPLYKALQYALNQWPYFENLLLDGRLEATNNLIERSIRPFAQGRASWMTLKTNRGAECSAAIYSVIQTALANDLKVYDYLTYLFKQMPNADLLNHPERLDDFLPWSGKLPENLFKSKKKESETPAS